MFARKARNTKLAVYGLPKLSCTQLQLGKVQYPERFCCFGRDIRSIFFSRRLENLQSIPKKQDSNPSIKNHHQKKNPTIEVDASRTA
jgi:hypothetical protein